MAQNDTRKQGQRVAFADWAFSQCIASMQYMKATLLAHSKEVRDDGSIVEVGIWGDRRNDARHDELYRAAISAGC